MDLVSPLKMRLGTGSLINNYMRIDLNTKEVYKILADKFGDATFRVYYEESNELWEHRTGKKIAESEKAPDKICYVLGFNKE